MQAIPAENQAKDFIHMINRLICLTILVILSSCEMDQGADRLPPISFDDIFINLSLPEFNDLQIQGYVYIQAGGNSRGIILRRNGNTYIAFERTCTYLPYEATAIVDVNVPGTAMTDYYCGSVFSFANGFPEAGPAREPLQQYRTILDGSFLTITDEVIN